MDNIIQFFRKHNIDPHQEGNRLAIWCPFCKKVDVVGTQALFWIDRDTGEGQCYDRECAQQANLDELKVKIEENDSKMEEEQKKKEPALRQAQSIQGNDTKERKAIQGVSLVVEGIQSFASREIPEQEMIIGNGILSPESITFIGGKGKLGKSIFALNMAICIATGKPFLGFPIPQTKRVLYIQQEIAEGSMHDRVRKVLSYAKQYDIEPTDEYLRIVNAKGLKLDVPRGVDALRALLGEQEPEVLILDPLYKFHNRKESDHQEMGTLVDTIDALVKEFKCSFIVIQHFGKSEELKGAHKFRGASVLSDYGDSYIILEQRDRESSKNYIKVSFELRNDEEPEPLQLFRNPETLWYEVISGSKSVNELTSYSVERLLTERGSEAKQTEIRKDIMHQYQVTEEKAKDIIDKAVKEGLIERPRNKGGKGHSSLLRVLPHQRLDLKPVDKKDDVSLQDYGL